MVEASRSNDDVGRRNNRPTQGRASHLCAGRRDAIPAAERQAAAATIAARPFPLPIPAGAIVSGFVPLKSEINPLPLMLRLAEAGARLALPVVRRPRPAADHALLRVRPGLNTGVWGIREPGTMRPRSRPTS